MPYTLKTNQISVKDPETGEYSGVDILAEQTEEGLIAEIQAEGTTQVNRIIQAAVDVQSAVDKAETDAAKIISDTQTSVNTLESQKNTIAQTVASMAELGTDTTLSTPGMAADAGAVGDLSRHLSDVHQVVTITLTAAGWSNNQQVTTVTGVLADVTKQMISPIPAPASEAAYVAAGVMAISQAADALTFRCVHVPTAELTVYVFIDEVVSTNA